MNVFKRQGRMHKIGLMFIAAIILYIIFPAILSAQVDTAWVRRYNGTGNYDDYATSIANDSAGNVYITGGSWGMGMNLDYTTIKYLPNGDTAWIRRYDGPGGGVDEAHALAVDHAGNVYVTGQSDGSGSSADYATIKYYPSGDTAWIRRYNGPGNNYDMAFSVAVDNSDYIYVTGGSDGASSDWDYTTIKYNSNGDTVWVRRYNGPENFTDIAFDMAVDNSGNIYVTGQSDGVGTDFDYATVKYLTNGDTAWVRRYNGPGNGEDVGRHLAIDIAGNVYVTGYSMGSGTNFDYATIKYLPGGDTAWTRRCDGIGNSYDAASSIAIDSSGNVYVTGQSIGTDSSFDDLTIKYLPNGDTAWTRRYNGPNNGDDNAAAMALDNSGNVFVTGSSYGPIGDDYTTIKYYPNGDTAWMLRYNGPGNGNDWAQAIAVDNSGQVFVTGLSWDPGSGIDYLTIKYSPIYEVDESFSPRSTPALKFDVSPNPAKNFCTIRFAQPAAHSVIRIYNAAGQLVNSFALRNTPYSLRWSGTDQAGHAVSQGVYFVQVDNGSAVGKIIITK